MKRNLTTIENSEGVSAEALKPTFEAYMQAVKQNHPEWSEDQLVESARDWELRNGFEPGVFEIPHLEAAKDPAPEFTPAEAAFVEELKEGVELLKKARTGDLLPSEAETSGLPNNLSSEPIGTSEGTTGETPKKVRGKK